MTDRTSLLRHESRCRSGGEEDESSQDKEEPEYIDVEVHGLAGTVNETETEYGRSVRLADKAEYKIIITNRQGSRNPVAVNITIDGRKVNTTAILVGAKRTIEGFRRSRNTVETVFDDGRYTHHTTTVIEPFCAVSQEVTPGLHVIDFAVDTAIGTIECNFFGVKNVRVQPGSHRRNHDGQQADQNHSQGRDGVMATRSDGTLTQRNSHVDRWKKPLPDKSQPKGRCMLTICELRVPSIGEYMTHLPVVSDLPMDRSMASPMAS